MGEISLKVDVHEIRDALQDEAEDYVKHIWYTRRIACVNAVGEVLNENGYLPSGTTWDAVGNECSFSVIKSGHELAHYFHEGMIYGPNIPVFRKYEYMNGRRYGVGEPYKFISPKGRPKKPNGEFLKQGVGSNLGVWHWTDAINGPLYEEYIDRCREILLR